MVITKENRAIPVAWLIHSSQSEQSVAVMLDKLAEHMGEGFTPSVVIVDDAQAEINAVKNGIWCGSEAGWEKKGTHSAMGTAFCSVRC